MSRIELLLIAMMGLVLAPAMGLVAQEETPPAAKKPVPSAMEINGALTSIRDLFQKEYAAARTPQQQVALADKLLDLARTTNDDPSAKYVLFRVARDIYVKLGDVDHVQAIADEVEDSFEVFGVQYRLEGLSAVGKTANGPARKLQLAQALAGLIDEAVRQDQFPQAIDAAKEALSHAKAAGDKDLPKWLAERQEAIAKQQALYTAAKAAIDKGDESDPAANLAAGQYYAFIKQDFKLGLEMLKKGANAEMAAAAATDISAPTDAAEMVKLADEWWAISDKNPDLAYGIKARALHWYRAALPSLTGIAKVKAEQRIAAAPPATGKRDPWFVLFRSGVPMLWGKNYTGPHGKAVAPNKAPAGIKYLRLTVQTKEPATIIIEMTHDRLAKKSATENYGWDGSGSPHANSIHLGVYHLHSRTGIKGTPVVTDAEFGRAYTGWGFGHVYDENVQCLSWNGKAIQPGTVVEIAVTAEPLTEEEQKLLLK